MSYNKVIVWGKKKSIDKRSSRLKSIQHLSILEKLKEKPKSIFDEKYGRPAGDEIFIKKEIYNGHQLITFKPYFKKLNGRYDQMLLICYKGHEKENKNNFIFTKKNKLFYFNFYLSDFYVNKIKNFFVKLLIR